MHRGLFFLAHLFFFGVFLFGFFLFLGKLPRELVGGRIDQAVDHLVDADFVLFDAVRERENLGDRGRACRNRLDHVLQAVLDALRDLDFAFARQQLDRAHLAHIHAHRVGGAAEFGIDGGERRLGLLDHVLVGDRRRCVRHQQRFGIGRLVVDVDAHVVDHADDVFDLLGVEHVVGQVVVDLGVGQVAALLAEHDQVLQAHAARFGLERRQFLARELPDQRLLFGGQPAGRARLAFQLRLSARDPLLEQRLLQRRPVHLLRLLAWFQQELERHLRDALVGELDFGRREHFRSCSGFGPRLDPPTRHDHLPDVPHSPNWRSRLRWGTRANKNAI